MGREGEGVGKEEDLSLADLGFLLLLFLSLLSEKKLDLKEEDLDPFAAAEGEGRESSREIRSTTTTRGSSNTDLETILSLSLFLANDNNDYFETDLIIEPTYSQRTRIISSIPIQLFVCLLNRFIDP